MTHVIAQATQNELVTEKIHLIFFFFLDLFFTKCEHIDEMFQVLYRKPFAWTYTWDARAQLHPMPPQQKYSILAYNQNVINLNAFSGFRFVFILMLFFWLFEMVKMDCACKSNSLAQLSSARFGSACLATESFQTDVK